MRALALLGAVVVSGCATLNTSGMSEPCKRLYDACLNSCERSKLPPSSPPTSGGSPDWQMDVAKCTDDCNKQAKSCQ
jgi:hypothetical protein